MSITATRWRATRFRQSSKNSCGARDGKLGTLPRRCQSLRPKRSHSNMPTPKAGYFLKDGSKVPGTTTIIGRFKDSGGLMFWAFEQGKSGKARLYDDAEKAADIGTCAHAMVEARIKGAGHFDLGATGLPEEDWPK